MIHLNPLSWYKKVFKLEVNNNILHNFFYALKVLNGALLKNPFVFWLAGLDINTLIILWWMSILDDITKYVITDYNLTCLNIIN